MKNLPAIPPGTGAPTVSAVAQTLRALTAQTTTAITPLDATATTAQIIAKVNEIIARLQGD